MASAVASVARFILDGTALDQKNQEVKHAGLVRLLPTRKLIHDLQQALAEDRAPGHEERADILAQPLHNAMQSLTELFNFILAHRQQNAVEEIFYGAGMQAKYAALHDDLDRRIALLTSAQNVFLMKVASRLSAAPAMNADLPLVYALAHDGPASASEIRAQIGSARPVEEVVKIVAAISAASESRQKKNVVASATGTGSATATGEFVVFD